MKKLQLLAWPKFCSVLLLGAGALFMASCASDGFDNDESFKPGNGVTNTKLTTPSGDDITITPSTDGFRQTIAWPVVYGAGGYKAVLRNLTTNEVLVDSILDGLSFATSREEDTNYKLTLQVLPNTTLGNSAGDPVDKDFSTFTPGYATIPSGTDLYQYFQENPIPDEETEERNYDLQSGGTYTLSQSLNFSNAEGVVKYKKVTLRSADKSNKATITIGDNANFVASNNFSLKYLNINVEVTDPVNAKPIIELYNYETDPDGFLEKPKNYYIIPSVNIIGCNIKGVVGSLIYDNNKSYAIFGLTIKDTRIMAKTVGDRIKNQAFISFQGGGVKDFTMENSTVYQTGEKINKYFLRYNNSVRVDRITGSNTDFTTFNWINNTFYNVLLGGTDGQWFNSNGPKDYSTYIVRNNIWVDCSKQIARRIKGNSQLGTNSQATFLHNTYWDSGEAADQGEHDTSGTILTTDPAFTDAANGNFKPTGAEQVQYQTGDPYWYTVQ